MLSGFDVAAEILKREGVECIFTYPDNDLIEACARVGIRPMQPRTERTAVAMADGYTRVNCGRRLGVVVVQYGPGIENAYGGVAQAYSDSTPLLVISGGASLERVGKQPDFDPVSAYSDITKWASRPTSVPGLVRCLQRALSLLRSGPPGPVLIDIPLEVGGAMADDAILDHLPTVPRFRSCPSVLDVSSAVDTLLVAERPVIQAGQGVLYGDASDELVDLAERLGSPVMTTLPGKSAFPEDHALSLGSGGYSYPETVSHFLRQCDLICGVGTSMTATVYGAPIPEGVPVVHMTVNERDVQKDYHAQHVLLGDVALSLEAVLAELDRRGVHSGNSGHAVKKEIADLRAESRKQWLPLLSSDELPLNPYRIISELIASVDLENTIITHDAGRPRDQLSAFWPAKVPHSYLGWGKSTHLGWGLGLIMGAKVASPDSRCINIMGDAAIGMVGMEFETAARLRLPITTIVFNNGAMSHYDVRYPTAYKEYGFKWLSGQYAELARALGVYSETIDRVEQIAPALRKAAEVNGSGEPAVLEFITKEEGRFAR